MLSALIVVALAHPHPRGKGGDADEHGCRLSAGYSYCEALKKCVRPWEEPCKAEVSEEVDVALAHPHPHGGGDADKHGCLISAGYSYCASLKKCVRTWEEPCKAEEPENPCPGHSFVCTAGSEHNPKLDGLDCCCEYDFILGAGNRCEKKPKVEASAMVNAALAGGDVDEHGCKQSAGYTYCASLKKCVHLWEEPCKAEEPENPCPGHSFVCTAGSEHNQKLHGLDCCCEYDLILTFDNRCEKKPEVEASAMVNVALAGGDVDEHGCKQSAGQSYCASLKKCVRLWEEPCKAEEPENPCPGHSFVCTAGSEHNPKLDGLDCCCEYDFILGADNRCEKKEADGLCWASMEKFCPDLKGTGGSECAYCASHTAACIEDKQSVAAQARYCAPKEQPESCWEQECGKEVAACRREAECSACIAGGVAEGADCLQKQKNPESTSNRLVACFFQHCANALIV